MILKLRNKKVEVLHMPVPELTEFFNIMIDFEQGTQHLSPSIIIDSVKYNGESIKPSKNKRIEIRVDLLDYKKQVIKTYRGYFQYYNYSVIGKPPVDINYFTRVKELEERIRVLEEQGEVI